MADFRCVATNYSVPVHYARKGGLAVSVSATGTDLEKQNVMTCSGNTCYSVSGDPELIQYSTILEVFRDEKGVLSAKNTFVIYPSEAMNDPGGVTVNFETWDCS
ncbi:hypothetical protein ACW9UR_21245 [Halovulum sp. GXIMD14794]